MRGLLKATQSSNDVSTPEISLNNLQVKWKMYKYLWTSFPALVCWSLKESNLVVVIVFSPQNSIMAPAEYTTSSVSFSLYQWHNLSSLIINKKIIPCDGHWPRTPRLPNLNYSYVMKNKILKQNRFTGQQDRNKESLELIPTVDVHSSTLLFFVFCFLLKGWLMTVTYILAL